MGQNVALNTASKCLYNLNMFVEIFLFPPWSRWCFVCSCCVDFKTAACRFETGRWDKRLPAHSPSKMNSDNLIRLNLRSTNPHAPSAALEVSVFAASPNPGFCAPAVSLLVDAAVRMLLNIFRSLYSALWRKKGLMAGWNFSSWLVISEVVRDYLFVWGIDPSLEPTRWNRIHV